MPLFLPLNALRRFTLKRDAMRVGTGEHNELHGSRETLLGGRKEKRKSDGFLFSFLIFGEKHSYPGASPLD